MVLNGLAASCPKSQIDALLRKHGALVVGQFRPGRTHHVLAGAKDIRAKNTLERLKLDVLDVRWALESVVLGKVSLWLIAVRPPQDI